MIPAPVTMSMMTAPDGRGVLRGRARHDRVSSGFWGIDAAASRLAPIVESGTALRAGKPREGSGKPTAIFMT